MTEHGTPHRHIPRPVYLNLLPSIDDLIYPVKGEHAVVVLSQYRQISHAAFQFVLQRSIASSLEAVAGGADRVVFALSNIDRNFSKRNYGRANHQRPNDRNIAELHRSLHAAFLSGAE